ncbi:hypothetical protein [Phaeobacter sp. HF9A]|uniref:hypothetical protein n=1 Tax=Phaeobacter sp. HF9A TaxID=2721561 RepID=UPI001431E128|nr:hypothetical protein [Phaeobacter sp. HF9A]NIZ15697.1 hypothetical protein [Phaeobacter sp. HF9A]
MRIRSIAATCVGIVLGAAQLSAEPSYQLVVPSGFYDYLEANKPEVSSPNIPKGVFEHGNPELMSETVQRKRFWDIFKRKPKPPEKPSPQQQLDLKPEFFTPGTGTALLAVNEFSGGQERRIAWSELPIERKKSLLSHLQSEVVISDREMNFGLLRTIGGVRTSRGEYTFNYQAMRSIHMPCSANDISSGYIVYGIGATVNVKSKFAKTGLSLALDGVADAVDFDNQIGNASIEVNIFGLKDPSYLSGLKSFFEGDVSHDNLKKAASFITAVGAEIGDEENWGDPVFVGIVDTKAVGECGKLLLEARSRS